MKTRKSWIAALAAVLLFSACHAQQLGQPAQQTAAQADQANSTSAPEATASAAETGVHYVASTDAKTRSVVFTIAINGNPGETLNDPKMRVDLHSYLRPGRNDVVVGWSKTRKGASGTLTIRSSTGKLAGTVSVTPAQADKGQKALTLVAR